MPGGYFIPIAAAMRPITMNMRSMYPTIPDMPPLRIAEIVFLLVLPWIMPVNRARIGAITMNNRLPTKLNIPITREVEESKVTIERKVPMPNPRPTTMKHAMPNTMLFKRLISVRSISISNRDIENGLFMSFTAKSRAVYLTGKMVRELAITCCQATTI